MTVERIPILQTGHRYAAPIVTNEDERRQRELLVEYDPSHEDERRQRDLSIEIN